MPPFPLLAILSFCALSGLACAKDDAAFAAAEKALDAGEFAEARDRFQAIVDAGGYAPEVFFGLGNSLYRLGETGPAALAYRRALFLDPAFAEAKQNLRFLAEKNHLVDTATEAQDGPVLRAPLIVSAILGGIVLVGCGVAVLVAFRKRPKGLTVAAVFGISIGAAAAIAGAVLARRQDAARPPQGALIVVKEGAAGHSAPAGSASEILPLPPGSALRPEATRGSWAYVKLGDELKGWVDKGLLEELWPFDSEASE
jgi:tetratricopeptide (TPR) repeat protein